MFDKGAYLKCMFLHWLILPCGQVALNILYDDYEEGFDIDQTTIDRESHEILDILRQNETFAGWIEKSSKVFMGRDKKLKKVRRQCKR